MWRQGVEPAAAFGHRAKITIGPKIITLTVKIVKLQGFELVRNGVKVRSGVWRGSLWHLRRQETDIAVSVVDLHSEQVSVDWSRRRQQWSVKYKQYDQTLSLRWLIVS